MSGARPRSRFFDRFLVAMQSIVTDQRSIFHNARYEKFFLYKKLRSVLIITDITDISDRWPTRKCGFRLNAFGQPNFECCEFCSADVCLHICCGGMCTFEVPGYHVAVIHGWPCFSLYQTFLKNEDENTFHLLWIIHN